jgi:hypothetical protein
MIRTTMKVIKIRAMDMEFTASLLKQPNGLTQQRERSDLPLEPVLSDIPVNALANKSSSCFHSVGRRFSIAPISTHQISPLRWKNKYLPSGEM